MLKMQLTTVLYSNEIGNFQTFFTPNKAQNSVWRGPDPTPFVISIFQSDHFQLWRSVRIRTVLSYLFNEDYLDFTVIQY